MFLYKFKNIVIKNPLLLVVMGAAIFALNNVYANIKLHSNGNPIITPMTITPSLTGVSSNIINYCVTINAPGQPTYSVTATTNTGSMVLRNGTSGPTIPFTAQWNDGYNTYPLPVSLTFGTAVGPFKSSGSSCPASPQKPITLTISVTQADLIAATAGTYTVTLTQTISATNPIYGSDTATVNITLTIPSYVDITNLSDITFTPTALTQNKNVCVYSNTTSHNYKITATGNGITGNPFSIVNGSDYVRYSVTWYNAISGGGTPLTLSSGVQTAAITGGSSSLNCGGGNSASFTVILDSTDIYSAPTATYSGTLSLLVSPG